MVSWPLIVERASLLHPASESEATEIAAAAAPACHFLLKFVRCNDNSPLSMRRFALRQGAKPVNQLWLRCNRATAATAAEKDKAGHVLTVIRIEPANEPGRYRAPLRRDRGSRAAAGALCRI